MTFLTILAISSASILPSFESRFVLELNEQLARHIFILGIKSLDLVQSMILYSRYYIRPTGSEASVRNQYIAAAVAMSYDLGLQEIRRDDPQIREKARTWLACWHAASA